MENNTFFDGKPLPITESQLATISLIAIRCGELEAVRAEIVQIEYALTIKSSDRDCCMVVLYFSVESPPINTISSVLNSREVGVLYLSELKKREYALCMGLVDLLKK